MSNTLTGLIPTLYEALNRVSREMVGFIPAVTRDSNAERAAKDQTVRVPIGDSGALEDVTPGADPASSGDTTVGYADIKITKSKVAPIRWNGEEEKGVGTTGQYNKVLADQFTGGMRKLVNAIETDLAVCGRNGASRAFGTAGTAPFGTINELDDSAEVLKILEENGAPKDDLQLALGSAAWANLRGKQATLFRVNEAGTEDMLRNGMAERLHGFALRNSSGIVATTNPAAAAYVTDGGTAAGLNAITAKTGTADIKAGDLFTLAGDTNIYVANADHAGAGDVLINNPGLMATVADAKALTFKGPYTPNIAFSRSAIVLACRAPAVPTGGDSADDSMMITDPLTGLTFEVRVYRQYRQVKYEIGMAWGVAAIKSEHIATLIG